MNIRIIILSCLFSLIGFVVHARDFGYAYNGQALTYTVIDEEAKTCRTKAGYSSEIFPNDLTAGNSLRGYLEIPEYVSDGQSDYKVIEIGELGFVRTYVTSVVLPESIEVIGNSAFYFSQLQDINFPASLTEIGPCAFEATRIKDVKIPTGVTSLGAAVFGNSVTNITMESAVPPMIDEYTFGSFVYRDAILNVPAGAEDAYRNAPNWDRFVNLQSAVGEIESESPVEASRYTTAGVPVDGPYKGLVIVRFQNGACEKIIAQ